MTVPVQSPARATALALCALALLAPGAARAAELQLDFETGWRNAELDWTIAGDLEGNNPNVLSELEWRDLGVFHFGAAGEARFGRGLVLRGDGSIGFIQSGRNVDSDFLGDDRTFLFSRSENAGDGGQLTELRGALGWRFDGGGARPWQIVPHAGLVLAEGEYEMTDGFQAFSDTELADEFGFGLPPVGPFPGLNSRYDTEWSGPFLGLDASFAVGLRWRLDATARLERLDYEAVADWNLREDFEHPRSFEHVADGDGVGLSLLATRPLQRIALRFGIAHESRSTDPGVDRVFFSDGTVGVTRLNEVDASSTAFLFGIQLAPWGR